MQSYYNDIIIIMIILYHLTLIVLLVKFAVTAEILLTLSLCGGMVVGVVYSHYRVKAIFYRLC